MIVETVEDGRTRSQHVTIDNLDEGTLIKSLILDVNQRQPGAHINFFVDCVNRGKISTPRAMRDMFSKMKRPELQVVSFFYYYILL